MANILVVDDDRDIILLVKHVLESLGHQVTSALHGGEALEKLGLEPEAEDRPTPDLIILDLMMPVLDGYSVSQRLAANPRTRSIPVLVLTAKDKMRELVEQSHSIAAFVAKPFETKRLQELVTNLLPTK